MKVNKSACPGALYQWVGDMIAGEAYEPSRVCFVRWSPGARAGGSGCKDPRHPCRALMKAGTQHDSSDEALRVLAALGVNHICSTLPSPRRDEHWSVEALTRLRERVESFGIKLDMAPLPMSSSYITAAENPNIILGKDPERDREIDGICEMIRNAGRAGIPALKYNFTILGSGAHRAHTRPRRRRLQHVSLPGSQTGAAAD